MSRRLSGELKQENYLNAINTAHLVELMGIVQILMVLATSKYALIECFNQDKNKELFITGI